MKKSTVLKNYDFFEPNGFPIAVFKEGLLTVSRIKPNYTEIEHSHNFWEIVLILGGRGQHCFEGNSFPVVSGDVFIIQKGQKHFFHDIHNIELINILYDPELLRLPKKEFRKLPGYSAMFMLEPKQRKDHKCSSRLHLSLIDLPKAIQITNKIESISKKKEAGWEVISLTSLQELIIYLSKCYTHSKTPNANALLRLANIMTLLEKEFMKPWSLDDLVKESNMSKGNFIRVFKNATGQTPIEYLIDVRIRHAMDLLCKKDLTITEIAYEVGFNDRNYFSRHFSKRVKTTPKKFRVNNEKQRWDLIN